MGATLFNSGWSTVAGFGMQWGLQSTTGSAITGTLSVRESFGGCATFTHLGPPGSVQGDAHLIGVNQIVPAIFRAMREGR